MFKFLNDYGNILEFLFCKTKMFEFLNDYGNIF